MLRIQGEINLNRYIGLGTPAQSELDTICAILIALLPILQHYKGVYVNLGFSLLLLVMPILLLRFLINMRATVSLTCLSAIVPLLVFEIYTIFVHTVSASGVAYGGAMMVIFVFIACGAVNVQIVFKSAVVVLKCAAVLITVQYITYYLFHYHVQLIPVGLLLEGSDIWIDRAVIGVSKAGEMYRPSAFFLEPSHMFLYSFPIIGMLLLLPFPDRKRIKDAVLISFGLLLSTSGFGIVAVAMLWGVFLTLYRNPQDKRMMIKRLFSFKTLLIIFGFILLIVVLYYTVPLVKSTVLRIFDSQSGTSAAISGRIALANQYISNLSGQSLLFGLGIKTDGFEFNMAGFQATLYKWGIVGVLLTYWFYGQGLVRLRGAYFYISAIIVVISFFTAHTHGTFYLIYYTIFLMNGYYMKAEIGTKKMQLGGTQSYVYGGL